MKSDTLNTALNVILAIFVLAAIFAGYRTLSLTYQVRALNQSAVAANSVLTKTQSLANDLNTFNQHSPNPELTQLLRSVAKH